MVVRPARWAARGRRKLNHHWYLAVMASTAPAPLPTDDPPEIVTPRWLDDEEQLTWRAFWLTTRMLSNSFERELQRETGIPLSYYEILVQLSEAPERTLRMSQLAHYSNVSRSALSHAVGRLEANGWVVRRDCPTDRRGALATLTDEGFAVLATAAPAHVESVRLHLFDQLSKDDLGELRRLFTKLGMQYQSTH
jgi:DNA-binding MarR family transcriptional regulator